jgi:hypothetical protein
MDEVFSFGPYEADSIRRPSLYLTRRAFFLEIERHRPQVGEDLYDYSFNPFVALIHQLFKRGLLDQSRQDGDANESQRFNYDLLKHISLAPGKLDDSLRTIAAQNVLDVMPVFFRDWTALQQFDEALLLRQSLNSWKARWNLNDDWCLDYAVIAMHVWLIDDAQRRTCLWARACNELSRTEKVLWSDRRVMLPPLPLLRTVRASFPAHGSSLSNAL